MAGLAGWGQANENGLGGPVGVGAEVVDLGAFGAFGEIVDFVAGDPADHEALGEGIAPSTVAVDHVVDGFLVALFPDGDVQDVLAHEDLVGDAGDAEGAVGAEADHVVEGGALAEQFVLLEAETDEAIFAVDVEFFGRQGDVGSLDGLEAVDHGAALVALAVLLLDVLEVGDRVLGQRAEMALGGPNVLLGLLDFLVRLEGIVLGNALDANLGEASHVVVGDFTFELVLEGIEPLVDF